MQCNTNDVVSGVALFVVLNGRYRAHVWWLDHMCGWFNGNLQK